MAHLPVPPVRPVEEGWGNQSPGGGKFFAAAQDCMRIEP
jgi:hypothetical protein